MYTITIRDKDGAVRAEGAENRWADVDRAITQAESHGFSASVLNAEGQEVYSSRVKPSPGHEMPGPTG